MFASLLSFLPPSSLIIGYGSGVKPQWGGFGPSPPSSPPSDPPRQLDFLVAVRPSDLLEWHSTNLRNHPTHYSFLCRQLGPHGVVRLQRYGAGVLFNPLVKVEGHLVKYGICGWDALLGDLTEWSHLFLSGRLHKPVVHVQWGKTMDDQYFKREFEEAQQRNIRSAIAASLILLKEGPSNGPQRIRLFDFLLRLSSLSYDGDIRMSLPFGESPMKVENIVRGSRGEMEGMYVEKMRMLQGEGWPVGIANCKEGLEVEVEYSPSTSSTLFGSLPPSIQSEWSSSRRVPFPSAPYVDQQQWLRTSLRSRVFTSSWQQALKGILSSGISKSVTYAVHKMRKAIRK